MFRVCKIGNRFRFNRDQRKCLRGNGFETLEARQVLAAAPVISEFMASNDDGLRDGFDRSSDWIEIHNAGDEAIDLAGWHLSDDADNLDKWTFPSATLAANDYLIVFASGCVVTGIECPTVETELHTNFSLGASGGYLALTQPDGVTIADQFAADGSSYARQYEDVSYGLQQGTGDIALVELGSSADVRFPTTSAAPSDWLDPAFDSSTAEWQQASVGIGYAAAGSEPIRIDFNDRTRADSDGDSEVGFTSFSINDNGATVQGVTTTLTAIGGAFLDDRDRSAPTEAPPAFTEDQLLDDFIFASGTNDGAGIEVELDGLQPGQTYRVKLWSYDASSTGERVSNWVEVLGDQEIESSYSFDGNIDPTSDGQFTLTGNVVASAEGKMLIRGTRTGGTSHGVFLNAMELGLPGIGDQLATDVGTAMRDVASTAHVRVPFAIDAGAAFESLTLSMRYNDGFVAYLNGTEVARRNAPGAAGTMVAGNATATAERTVEESSVAELIDLTSAITTLRPGEPNVLAIHGLNRSATDGNFLIEPELIGQEAITNSLRYFAEATPGSVNGSGFVGVVGDTSFSADRGMYDAPFTLQITSDTPGATLIYTTDGSLPSLSNGTQVATDLFSSPIASLPINTTTYVRAMAIKDRFLPTNVDTQTYVFLDDVIRQDPLSDPNSPDYPTRWQANAEADFEMDPEVVAKWDDNNPDNQDAGIPRSVDINPHDVDRNGPRRPLGLARNLQ